MIETGATYRNPRSGARAKVIESWSETGNRRFVWERTLPPGTGRADPHLHLDYRQTFECVEGVVKVEIDGTVTALSPGERVVIERDTVHRDGWNEGPGDAGWRMTIEPVPRFIEVYGATYLDAFARGKLNDQDEMPLLQILRIIHETDGQSFAAFPPRPIQRLTLPIAALIARIRGHRVVQ